MMNNNDKEMHIKKCVFVTIKDDAENVIYETSGTFAELSDGQVLSVHSLIKVDKEMDKKQKNNNCLSDEQINDLDGFLNDASLSGTLLTRKDLIKLWCKTHQL